MIKSISNTPVVIKTINLVSNVSVRPVDNPQPRDYFTIQLISLLVTQNQLPTVKNIILNMKIKSTYLPYIVTYFCIINYLS